MSSLAIEEELDFESSKLLISVHVGGSKKTLNLSKYVEINEGDISEEFAKQAAIQAWIGSLYEQAQSSYRTAEIDFEAYEASLSNSIRAKADTDGSKLTEAKLQAMILSSPAHLKLRHTLNEIRSEVDQLKIALRAIEEKGNMLVSLGAQKRQELSATGMQLGERLKRLSVPA